MSSTTEQCCVCAENFNQSNRKKITCNQCNFESCTSCIETYLKTSLMVPQCMKCHKLWNHQYVRQTFGTTFVKRIQDTQKEILFKEQKTLLPHTQEYVNLQSKKQDLRLQRESVQEKMRELILQRDNIDTSMGRVMNEMYWFENPSRNPRTKNPQTTKYVRMCGQEDCKGYVNEKDGHCELCKTEYCLHCMEEKNEDHECKQENIDTIKLLKKDSKNCPKCSTMIFRISGCPDMFCVHCNTAFNWNTLEINERGNSNPHYYEWLRNNTGNGSARVNECGTEIQLYDITHFRNYKKLTYETKSLVMDCLRSIHHRENNLYSFLKNMGNTRNMTNNTNEIFISASLTARSKFMKNELNETQFKTSLMKIHKAMEYNTHIRDIGQVLRTYKQDMMRALRDESFDIKVYIQEYVNFANYINDCVIQNHELFYKSTCNKFIDIPKCCNIYLAN